MINLDENTITAEVFSRMGGSINPRLKFVMTSLVQHLHDFAREVKLTEDEWVEAINFLTETGQKCDANRQEFILLSDIVGLSTLVSAQNNQKPPECTEATVFGPFHVADAPEYALGGDVGNGMIGEVCHVTATVKGLNGDVIAGAKVDIWQADADGKYDVQYADLKHPMGRGVLKTDGEGKLFFKSILAEAYPVPHDGPVGRLLQKMDRHPWRPAHLHFMIEAPGYETLVTHVFRRDGKYLESDAVFGVRKSLIADWIKQPDGSYKLHFDFVLNPLSADSASVAHNVALSKLSISRAS